MVCLYADPDDADDDVHALALAAVVFEAPHTVRLLVPEGLGGRVHAAPADVRLPVGSGRVAAVAGADARALLLDFASSPGFVEGRGRDEVLHNGAIDHVLMTGSLSAGGSRLGYDSSEDRVLA